MPFADGLARLRWTVPPNIGQSSFARAPAATASASAAPPSTAHALRPGSSLISVSWSSFRALSSSFRAGSLLRDRPQAAGVLGDDVEHPVDGDGGGPDLGAQLVGHGELAHQLLLLAVLEDVDLA